MPPTVQPSECQAREVLDRVGDKWSMFVIGRLGAGTMRFTELLRSIDGISQRMLTVTLRGLERDGIVTRVVHPVIPPRVEYTLTPLGATLLDAVGALIGWSHEHLAEVDAARAAYDARNTRPAEASAEPPAGASAGASAGAEADERAQRLGG
jgi:DNA-binding HxlR family transcriptional regulator